MTEYKRYPEYKDSGVEWLGEIPVEWELMKLKKGILSLNGGVWGEEPNLEEETIRCIRVADFDRDTASIHSNNPTERSYTSREILKKAARSGDLIIEKSGGGEKTPVGNVVLYSGDAPVMYSNFVAKISLREGQNSKFWAYLFATLYSKGINLKSIKQNTGIQNLDISSYFNEAVSVPCYETQYKIVEFLDRETAHIDAGVANMEALITLLTEKRAALISETVTRGIPGEHTEFKDSSVDWLGEIPVEWRATDPKNVFMPKSDSGQPDDIHLMASQKYGVIPQAEYLANTGKRVVEVFSDTARFKRIAEDDFLIHLRSFQGGIEYSKNYGKVTSAYTVISPKKSFVFPHYYRYLLKSKDYIRALASTTNQLRDGQSIKWKDFRQVFLPVPPMQVQKRIVEFLDHETAQIDGAVSHAEALILLLKEKRQTLISEVVTGKIDVSGT